LRDHILFIALFVYTIPVRSNMVNKLFDTDEPAIEGYYYLLDEIQKHHKYPIGDNKHSSKDLHDALCLVFQTLLVHYRGPQ